MWVNRQPCILLLAGIVSIRALIVGSSSSLAFDGRRLLEAGSGGGQFRLMHYTHPDSPHHVPGLTHTEKVKYGVLSSRERVAFLSSRMAEAGVPSAKSGSRNLGASSTSFVTPLSTYPGRYEYAMEISIGTPPQKISVLADTGSSLVWVRCSPCSNCSVPSEPLFHPKNSSTYTKMSCSDPRCKPIENACNPNCQYKYGYGSGEGTIGDLSYETITLNTFGTGMTTTASNFAFGCGSNITGNFTRQAPPIAGLGMGPLSFTSQLGSLYGHKFSYCLVSLQDHSNITSPLLFGDAAVPTVPTQYTPILINPRRKPEYYIGLKGIKVDGVALDIPSGTFDVSPNGTGGVISDSGTSVTHLVTAAYSPLLKKMQSVIKYPVINAPNVSDHEPLFDLCYNLSNVARPALPKVTMVFEGFSLDLPDENVFVVVDNENSTCMAFADGFKGFSIWGNIQQQNFQVLHDLEAMQFGYAKVRCDEMHFR